MVMISMFYKMLQFLILFSLFIFPQLPKFRSSLSSAFPVSVISCFIQFTSLPVLVLLTPLTHFPWFHLFLIFMSGLSVYVLRCFCFFPVMLPKFNHNFRKQKEKERKCTIFFCQFIVIIVFKNVFILCDNSFYFPCFFLQCAQ